MLRFGQIVTGSMKGPTKSTNRLSYKWPEIPSTQQVGGVLPRPITMLIRSIPAHTAISIHSHSWGQLVYASAGVMSVRTEQGSYLVPLQRAVWVPPNLLHSIGSLEGAQLASVYIEPEQALGLADSCYVLQVNELLKQLILQAARLPVQYHWQGRQGRLFRTLRDQICDAPLVPLHLPLPSDARLLQICESLEKDPQDPRSIEQFGAVVGASSRTLARLFNKQTGMGFRAWRQQLRLQVSLEKLASGDSVTNVALDLGYQSASAFIVMFKQQLGVTPGEYFCKD